MTKLIIIGGIFNLSFAIFHLFFWKLFNWKDELKGIDFINQNIMQVLNLCLIFVFFVFSYISIFHTNDMLNTGLGISLTLCIAVFWFLRSLEQIIFFKLKTSISWILLILFIVGTFLYGIPLFLIR